MPQRHLYLLLGSLDDEIVRIERLPMSWMRMACARGVDDGNGDWAGIAAPVMSDGLPGGFEVAARR